MMIDVVSKFKMFLITCYTVFATSQLLSAATDFHVFTDKTGTKTFEGKLLGFQEDTGKVAVRLQTTGKKVIFSIDSLSEKDIEYVKAAAKGIELGKKITLKIEEDVSAVDVENKQLPLGLRRYLPHGISTSNRPHQVYKREQKYNLTLTNHGSKKTEDLKILYRIYLLEGALEIPQIKKEKASVVDAEIEPKLQRAMAHEGMIEVPSLAPGEQRNFSTGSFDLLKIRIRRIYNDVRAIKSNGGTTVVRKSIAKGKTVSDEVLGIVVDIRLDDFSIKKYVEGEEREIKTLEDLKYHRPRAVDLYR